MTSSPSTISMRSIDNKKGWRIERMRSRARNSCSTPGAARFESMIGTVNKLDGFVQTTRRFAFPDFAEAALTERFEQTIARNRLSLGMSCKCHRPCSLFRGRVEGNW